MIQTSFYAHSTNTVDKSDWQGLSEHLFSVRDIAAHNARFFDGASLAGTIGLLHDLGKYSIAFQNRLSGAKERADHATAGAKVAAARYGPLGQLAAFAIAGHHAGLANGVDEGIARSTLKSRLSLTHGDQIPILDVAWESEIPLPHQIKQPDLVGKKYFEGFQWAFLTRMVFSCLIDADRKDTSEYYMRLEAKPAQTSPNPTLLDLQIQFDSFILEKFSKAEASEVNSVRNEVLRFARAQANLAPGLFSLTVPTGGGKTLTSLGFALDHAVLHHQRRIIYVIPFTSIIEQNAAVFRSALGKYSDQVLEHHSAFDDSNLRDQNAKDNLRQATESWDSLVVVTTAVQFFESLFSDRTTQCRKLHNITGSVIVLDEAQTLPLKLLRPIVAAIDELARNYQCTVVLCTATQPALLKASGFIDGFENVRPLVANSESLFRNLRRVNIKYLGELKDEALLPLIMARQQVLVIVNNRRHARSLFDSIIDADGAIILTTLLCPKHRRHVMDSIRELLKLGKPCRVIATSLVEAGVDLDFPCVFRAEAGLDSIAQAAGRCNREGKRDPAQSDVFVFQPPDWSPPPELETLAASTRGIARTFDADELLSPIAINEYFNSVYWIKGDELDSKRLLETHRNHANKKSFPFQNIARDFRFISTVMRTVIIPFDETATALIKSLHFVESAGAIARELQHYIVQIPQQAFIALVNAGAVGAVEPLKFGDQFWQLNLANLELYDHRAGLSWENPTFISAERLVM